MNIVLFEFITGGGLFCCQAETPVLRGLQQEAAAMRGALLQDLSRLADVSLTVLQDGRSPWDGSDQPVVWQVNSDTDLWEQLRRASATADCVIAIAPETDTWLKQVAKVVEDAGVLLGPSASFVEVTANKQTTKKWLRELGIPCPTTLNQVTAAERLCRGESVICKPTIGAGGDGVRRIHSAEQLPASNRDHCFLEEFVPGRAMSVSWLCGPEGCVQLQPCDQLLETSPQFRYCASRVCTDERLVDRARQLVEPLRTPLMKQRGYLGIDLVLGCDDSGGQDVVIEVNPRLTSSYVALREWHSFNIAEQMLRTAFSGFAAHTEDVV